MEFPLPLVPEGDPIRKVTTIRVVALVGSLTLLAVSAAVVVRNARERTATALDERLAAAASVHREALDAHFERTREIAHLVARNPAFAPLGVARNGDRPALETDLEAATAALTYLQRVYPGQIREAGVVDARGAEVATWRPARRVRRSTPRSWACARNSGPCATPTTSLPPRSPPGSRGRSPATPPDHGPAQGMAGGSADPPPEPRAYQYFGYRASRVALR